MLYGDLLRTMVLVISGIGTALGAVTIIAVNQDADAIGLIVAVVWWAVAVGIGFYIGRSSRAVSGIAPTLASARTATSLPPETPTRIIVQRLWPVAAFALVAGGLGWIWPQVPAVGAGYGFLVALAWRNREPAVRAIEERDGVRFYVEPSSAFQPVKLIRTPGLGRDRMPRSKPPPPPPAEAPPAKG